MNKTKVLTILDKSTSMSSCREAAIEGFNECMDTISKTVDAGNETSVSLITFSTTPEVVYWDEPADKITKLDQKDFIPSGWTALYDAIGGGVNRLLAEATKEDKDTAYLVMIITDGEENRSVEFNRHSIQELISRLQKTDQWTFTYLGANVNVENVSDLMSIPKGNIASYTSDAAGTRVALQKMSHVTTNYMSARGAGTMAVNNLMSDDGGTADWATDPVQSNLILSDEEKKTAAENLEKLTKTSSTSDSSTSKGT